MTPWRAGGGDEFIILMDNPHDESAVIAIARGFVHGVEVEVIGLPSSMPTRWRGAGGFAGLGRGSRARVMKGENGWAELLT